jgi:hypothetical protein
MADTLQPTASPVFLGWSTQLAYAVACELIASTLSKEERQARGSGKWRLGGASDTKSIVDLGGHIVIVPAPMAGRLIQEALAKICSSGLLIPRFVTPSNFLNEFEEGVPAREADALLAWIEVLSHINRTDYPNFFPLGEDTPMTYAEAQRLASSLMKLRDELGGSATGHSFLEVAQLKDNPEPDRWSDLARLEAAYSNVLAKRGLADHNDRRRHAARNGKATAGTTHIWLAGVADPQPLVISTLGRFASEGIHVQALVGADKNEGDAFDAWGRPTAAVWNTRELDWPEFNDTVHVVQNPLGGIAVVRSLLNNQAPVPGTVTLCACDRESDSPKLAALVRSLGAEATDPLGRLHASSSLHHALRSWAACLRKAEPTFSELRAAFHVPEIVKGIAGGQAANAYDLINTSLDNADVQMTSGRLSELLSRAAETPDAALHAKEVDARQALAELKGPLGAIARKREEHLSLAPSQALKVALQDLVGKRPFRADQETDAFLLDVLEELDEVANTLGAAGEAAETLQHADFFELALELAGQSRFRWSEGSSAVNLPGWLEATWDPVPHLIIFGLNDHLVPRAKHADPFLPAKLRELVGLPANGDVFAAAAFALEQMRRQRLKGGRLDIIVPQADENNEPLRPSRLLFLGPVDKLPERVNLLFGESEESGNEPYWEIPSKYHLNPRAAADKVAKLGKTLSASSMATYLADPAEYWMQKALGLRSVEFGQIELNHADFGTLLHSALERWAGAHLNIKGPSDAEVVAADMIRCLNEHVRSRFGATPPPAVRLQVDIAARRLTSFAPRQVKLWQEGWVIAAVEKELPEGFVVGEAKITGRFDRIDRHTETNKWRVYDYKTFSDAKGPDKKHLRRRKSDEADFLTSDEKRRWVELQMPLYKWVMGERWPGINGEANVDVGYICLPAQIKTAKGDTEEGETHVKLWEKLDEEMTSAKTAIARVEELIRTGGTAAYRPTGRSEYPLLPGLAKRPIEGWMDTMGLGEVRK